MEGVLDTRLILASSSGPPRIHEIARNWRWAVFRAALAIVFGVTVGALQMLVSALAFFAVLRPPWAFAAVVWLFGALHSRTASLP